MNSIEKSQRAARNRKLKKQEKKFRREEKASLARQKRELHEKKKKYRRKSKIFSKLRKYLDDRKKQKSINRKLKNENRYLREKVRRDKIQHFKEQIVGFFLNPFGRKRTSKKEELIRQRIQKGIRKQKFEEIKKYPEKLSSSIEKIGFKQRMRVLSIRNNIRRTTSGFKDIKGNPEIQVELLKSYLNSLATFLLAFVILYLVCNLASVVAAKYFNIPAILYSYRIFWPLYTYSSLYSRQALIIIFAAGPLVSILLAILLFQILKRIVHFRLNLKILLMWMIFHAMNLFFGAYIIGVITRTGFIYTTEWLFFSNIFDVEEILFMIISIITLIIIGYYFTRYFILSSNSNTIILPKIRFFYIVTRVLLPWLTGVLSLYFLNYPNNPPELILLLSVSFLMIIPAFANLNSIQNKRIVLRIREDKEYIGWIYILGAACLLAFYRIVLFNGVSFG